MEWHNRISMRVEIYGCAGNFQGNRFVISLNNGLFRTVPTFVTAHTSAHLEILGFPMGGAY